jgi:hypothetical protein
MIPGCFGLCREHREGERERERGHGERRCAKSSILCTRKLEDPWRCKTAQLKWRDANSELMELVSGLYAAAYLPTMEGKTARGASSPAKPALHIPEPLSTTSACTSSSACKFERRRNASQHTAEGSQRSAHKQSTSKRNGRDFRSLLSALAGSACEARLRQGGQRQCSSLTMFVALLLLLCCCCVFCSDFCSTPSTSVKRLKIYLCTCKPLTVARTRCGNCSVICLPGNRYP